jgi:adenosylcobinamide-GDP ribazoletransferase
VLNDFFLALGTLTRIRVPEIKKINYQKSTVYFPVVGFVAAGILFSSDLFFKTIFTSSISKTLALIIYYLLFGFFHFDGLLDCIDGFFPSHKTREERLRIMKDSNTGAFALLFGVIFLLLEVLCLMNSGDYWYYFPVFGRFTPIFLLSFSKPASDKGLGKLYFPYSIKYLLYSFVFFIPMLFVSLKIAFWIIFVLFLAIIISNISKRKINGITGDVIGFSIMISEVCYLLYLNTAIF